LSGALEWVEREGGWFLELDAPGAGPPRYLGARRGEGEDAWRAVAVLASGEEERDLGEQPGLEVAKDMALKLGIQVLARLHGVSPAPGLPDADAPDVEHLIARLWEALARLHAR
jgi:hypothetical protein